MPFDGRFIEHRVLGLQSLVTTCIGMSREFAEEWNKTSVEEKFIYVEVDGKCGYVMRSGAFKEYPDVMSQEELTKYHASLQLKL